MSERSKKVNVWIGIVYLDNVVQGSHSRYIVHSKKYNISLLRDPVGQIWSLVHGLSFDTATQVGLIGLAAMTDTTGAVPGSIVMVIPVCFSTGMCLVDTGAGDSKN